MSRLRRLPVIPELLMPIVKATRRVHFSSAHRLYRPEWSDDRNAEVFGDCSNPNWHGHNYELYVTVEGPVDTHTGFVMNLRDLKDVLEKRVISDVDHRNLNVEVEWLTGIIPSTENVTVAIWDRVVDALPDGVRLVKVALHETPRHFAEYLGQRETSGHD